MRDNGEDKTLIDGIRENLDRQANEIDDRTLRALKSMRFEALDSLENKRSFFSIPRWVSATGIATAVVLVAAVSLFYVSPRNTLQVKSPEEFEMLSTSYEQQELYKDLDFYRWLAEDAG